MNIKKIKNHKKIKKSFFFLASFFALVLFGGILPVFAQYSGIYIDKTTTFSGSATVGDEIPYIIRVTSSRTLKNVSVNDRVNDSLILNLNGPDKQGGDQDDLLEVGESWIYTGSYVATENDICGQIVNTATASAQWDASCINPTQATDSVTVLTVCFGSISGFKFKDYNGDGNWGSGENGIENWVIFLDENSNETLDTGEISTVTSSDGSYSFENLLPGEYTVCEVLKDEWTQSLPESGCYQLNLASEENITDKNFGNFQNGRISGFKYNDLNGNGAYDQGDPGIEGWEITLSGGRAATALTNVDGYYHFTNLEPGNYTVIEETRSGWTATTPTSLNVSIFCSSSDQNNFLNYEEITISGSKFNDLNGNGAWDQGEPALDGWEICVKGGICVLTGYGNWADGYYEFTNLGPGVYTIEETLQSGWVKTAGPSQPITVVSGQNVSSVNFGNKGSLSICGYKYNDLNGNGLFDSGEPGIEGWKITLGKDKTDTTLTNNNGHYCFGGLEPGNYTVTEETRTDWTATSVNTINVILGETSSSANNFFNFKKASISGYKFNDLNGNGVWDANEPALNGWQICIKGGTCVLTGDGLWSDGYYEFTNLGPGVYTIEETLQAGWTQIAGPSSSITVVSGRNVSSVNFGNKGSLSICGYKYNDLNGNGLFDSGEPGIEGWKMTLGGSKSGSTLTDKNGYYCFGNLQPGNYTVAEETRADWIATSPSAFYFGGITKSQTVNFFNSRDPVLEILKTNNISTFINPGGKVIYTIKVTNTGGGAAINFNVYDALPAGFSYVNGSSVILGANGSGPTLSDNVLIWTVERLNLSSSFTISYEALTDKGILAGIYFNTASVMNKSDDSSVEVRVPMVLAESTQKGKVLGASVKTGLSFWNLVLLNFFLILIIYCIGISIRLKFREKFRFHRESSTKSGPAPILPS